MKLKNRIFISFFTIIILPVILYFLLTLCLGKYKVSQIEKTYGINLSKISNLTNPIFISNKITEKNYKKLILVAKKNPYKLNDENYLDKVNMQLKNKKSYIIVRRGEEFIYFGKNDKRIRRIIKKLPVYDKNKTSSSVYLGEKTQIVLKQLDFTVDGEENSLFLITDVCKIIPEGRVFIRRVMFWMFTILTIIACCLIFWIYKGILDPVKSMQEASERIRNGDLDFRIKAKTDDELGMLAQDLDAMRWHLKNAIDEKIKYDDDGRELISNISHDLKTPITAIKGYAEGIMDGVADTPEKQKKYIKTIYNKASEMEILINELALYTKINSNVIPYNFQKVNVNKYFKDCADELSIDLSAREIDFTFHNYASQDTFISADPEQIARVINNLVANSIKYMDKADQLINMRVKDIGNAVQIEIEDNGIGIGSKELPFIFDRFYRSDASRNSEKGGSGIGLSIAKKIIEDHDGRIWAISRESVGTTMFFALKKHP